MDDGSLSIRIDIAGGRIGPGKIRLLRAVREHGSVSAAARALGMSYRRAWSLTEDLNALSRTVLIAKSTGGAARGGAALTSAGEEVLAICERIVADATHAAAGDLEGLGSILKGD